MSVHESFQSRMCTGGGGGHTECHAFNGVPFRRLQSLLWKRIRLPRRLLLLHLMHLVFTMSLLIDLPRRRQRRINRCPQVIMMVEEVSVCFASPSQILLVKDIDDTRVALVRKHTGGVSRGETGFHVHVEVWVRVRFFPFAFGSGSGSLRQRI